MSPPCARCAETESLLTAPPGEPAEARHGRAADLRRRAAGPARRRPTTWPAGSAWCATRGWHPFTVLWCVDYIEQARAVLDGRVPRGREPQPAAPASCLDRVVEDRAHGIGRALWRDIGCAAVRVGARRAARCTSSPGRVRIADARAADGARASACASSPSPRAPSRSPPSSRAMHTEPFAADRPPVLRDARVGRPGGASADRRRVRRARDLPQRRLGPDRPERRIRLHLPTAADERRLTVPPYGRSYFELVRRSFQRRCEDAALAPKKAGDPSAPDPTASARTAPGRPPASPEVGRVRRGAAHRARADRLDQEGPAAGRSARSTSCSCSTAPTSPAACARSWRRRPSPCRSSSFPERSTAMSSDSDLGPAKPMPAKRRGREDHGRGAQPQHGRSLGARGGARDLLRGRRRRPPPRPTPSSASTPPPSKIPPPTTAEGRARSAPAAERRQFLSRLRREARYQQTSPAASTTAR